MGKKNKIKKQTYIYTIYKRKDNTNNNSRGKDYCKQHGWSVISFIFGSFSIDYTLQHKSFTYF